MSRNPMFDYLHQRIKASGMLDAWDEAGRFTSDPVPGVFNALTVALAYGHADVHDEIFATDVKGLLDQFGAATVESLRGDSAHFPAGGSLGFDADIMATKANRAWELLGQWQQGRWTPDRRRHLEDAYEEGRHAVRKALQHSQAPQRRPDGNRHDPDPSSSVTETAGATQPLRPPASASPTQDRPSDGLLRHLIATAAGRDLAQTIRDARADLRTAFGAAMELDFLTELRLDLQGTRYARHPGVRDAMRDVEPEDRQQLARMADFASAPQHEAIVLAQRALWHPDRDVQQAAAEHLVRISADNPGGPLAYNGVINFRIDELLNPSAHKREKAHAERSPQSATGHVAGAPTTTALDTSTVLDAKQRAVRPLARLSRLGAMVAEHPALRAQLQKSPALAAALATHRRPGLSDVRQRSGSHPGQAH